MAASGTSKPTEPKGPAEPAKRVIKAGGHEILADPEPATPAEYVQCSVCGAMVDQGKCPNGHGAAEGGGWSVAEQEA